MSILFPQITLFLFIFFFTTTLLTGGLGSGKTLWLVFYAKEKIPPDESIYTNFTLRLSNAKKINYEEMWEISEGYLLIDELQYFVDSYKSMSTENTENSYYFLDTRKKYLQIFATTQLKMMIIKRFRDICEYMGRAIAFKDRYCYYFEHVGFQHNFFTIMKDYAQRELYPLYNSYEHVARYESPDAQAKRLKKLRPKAFFEYARKLSISPKLNFRNNMSIPEIEIILGNNGESCFYAKYICQMLKKK